MAGNRPNVLRGLCSESRVDIEIIDTFSCECLPNATRMTLDYLRLNLKISQSTSLFASRQEPSRRAKSSPSSLCAPAKKAVSVSSTAITVWSYTCRRSKVRLRCQSRPYGVGRCFVWSPQKSLSLPSNSKKTWKASFPSTWPTRWPWAGRTARRSTWPGPASSRRKPDSIRLGRCGCPRCVRWPR